MKGINGFCRMLLQSYISMSSTLTNGQKSHIFDKVMHVTDNVLC